MARDLVTESGREVQKPDTPTSQSRQVFRPVADIYETSETVVVAVDMPGVAPEDVEVFLKQQVLVITGRFSPVRPDSYRALYSEYGEGNDEGAFLLSQDVAPDRIEANHRNGVLTLKLPKVAAAKTRKIDVKAA